MNDERMSAGIASITAHARAQAERERLDAEKAAAVPAPPEIANRPGRAERKVAETVRCPFCKASADQPCRASTKDHHVIAPHPSRLTAAGVKA